jgi:hypothetical protein
VPPSVPAPDAAQVRYGDKRHLVFVLAGVLVFGGLTALGVNGFAGFESTTEKVIGGIITGFFALGLVFCAFAAVMLPFRRHRLPGVAVDAAGIWWHRDRRFDLVAWPEVAGVGVSYLQAPGAAVAAGASLGQRKNHALEVFLRGPALPALRTWAVTEPPPVPALPADRLRFVLPAGGDRHALQAAVARHAPALWAGEYVREWSPLGMLGK